MDIKLLKSKLIMTDEDVEVVKRAVESVTKLKSEGTLNYLSTKICCIKELHQSIHDLQDGSISEITFVNKIYDLGIISVSSTFIESFCSDTPDESEIDALIWFWNYNIITLRDFIDFFNCKESGNLPENVNELKNTLTKIVYRWDIFVDKYN